MVVNKVEIGDSLYKLNELPECSVDMIYMDPPFFTQETQRLTSSKDEKEYVFYDKWENMDEYIKYIKQRVVECKRILKNTGSIFVHCDRNASHYLKIMLDEIFGYSNFQSEIVWIYKRWSNSKKGLMNNHQIIFFYSKTTNFKFNRIYTDYSETTNIDQILQERIRDVNGKSKYKTTESGEIVIGTSKKGVPLSDVWEIPYLNPKAKERVGYPTQKPIILLEQIIKLATDEGDVVLDPFVGSGTTLVAAKLLNRKFYGIDISKDAVELTKTRLAEMVKTESFLLKKGKQAYRNLSEYQINILKSLNAIPVQRNSGIDGFLSEYIEGTPIAVKIQKETETIVDSVEKLKLSSQTKKCKYAVLIKTHHDTNEKDLMMTPSNIFIIDAYDLLINEKIYNKSVEK